MRVEVDFVRAGYFWLPLSPDKKIPGTLRIADGGEITLEVVGNFDADGDFAASLDAQPIARILGLVEKEGLVTLDGGSYTNKTTSWTGGISKSKLRVVRALFKVHYDHLEPVLLNEMRFTVDGLDDWLGVSGIQILDTQNGPWRTTISFQLPEPIVFDWGDSPLRFSFSFEGTMPNSVLTEARVSQKAYVRIESTNPVEVAELIRVAYQITNFLAFATDAAISIREMYVAASNLTDDFGGDVKRRVQMRFIYRSRPFSTLIPSVSRHTMLFRFQQIHRSFPTILNMWLEAYESIGPALNLYFAARSGEHKYIDNYFLSLAQGLETYHRRTCAETLMPKEEFEALVLGQILACPPGKQDWLIGRLQHANEINLGQRIKKIVEPFKEYLGNNAARSALCRKIVITRNYLTHYSEENAAESAKGRDLLLLCIRMEAIFQLHLLKQIGFTKEEIANVVSGESSVRKKLHET